MFDVIGILLYACPIIAFILLQTATRHHHHRWVMVVCLSFAFVAAGVLVYDYLSCTYAFAELSPIFGIEYSFVPHDGIVFAAFVDLGICLLWLPICIVQGVHKHRERKERRLRCQAEYNAVRAASLSPSSSVSHPKVTRRSPEGRDTVL